MTTPQPVRDALKAHGMYRIHGHPLRPEAWECVGCGHMAKTPDERLEHRAAAVYQAALAAHEERTRSR